MIPIMILPTRWAIVQSGRVNGTHGVTRPTSETERRPIGRAGSPLPAVSSIRGFSRDTVWKAEMRF